VTLKIRLAPFRTFTRSRTLGEPTADRTVVGATAHELLERFERDAPVRLLGVGVAGLEGENASEAPAVPEGRAEASGSLQLQLG
ncbi:MAG TPA: hypothetical protein VFY99_11505, partial [Solirubrobacterales bacterium]